MKALFLFLSLCGPIQAAVPDFAPGSRAAAMGEAAGMLRGSLEGSWYNPAALAGLSLYRLNLSSLNWAEGTTGQFASLGMNRYGGWPALALTFASVGATDTRRDAQGRELGDFSVQAQRLKLASALPLGHISAGSGLSAGLGLEMEKTSVASSENSAFAFEAGAQYGLNERFIAGLSLRRLPIQADAAQPSLAEVRLSLGAYDPFVSGLFAGAELNYVLERAAAEAHLGLQYVFGQAQKQGALRLGWQSGASGLGGLAGFSAGLGGTLGRYSLDYAWLPLSHFGDAHRFGLTLNFEHPQADPTP